VSQKNNESFVSIIKLLNNSLGNDVHFVWALSKDLASSGFRVGILYSQNMDLITAIQSLSIFSCVPFPMQLITMGLLMDTPFLVEFFELSRQNIILNKEICTTKLHQLSLPYVEAAAGIFLYVDFSSLLPPDCTFVHEAKFARLMENTARVVMTPGESQRDRRPGWFRICYTWVTTEVLQIAMCRIELMVNYLRTIGTGWSSKSDLLDEEILANVLLVKGDCCLRN
jgi:aspartate/methionine/tyrosine aminotransferase